MKKLFWVMLVMVPALGLMLGSCASGPALSLFNGPHPTLSSVNAVSEKTGTASSTVVFGFGRTTYPTISEAAGNGGITKIATVEYYNKPFFFRLFVQYTTIVTGE
ncbi:MAG: TRL-like family protein [Treponema sp.]|nr:TRL-like family protein [Treponema sp.]